MKATVWNASGPCTTLVPVSALSLILKLAGMYNSLPPGYRILHEGFSKKSAYEKVNYCSNDSMFIPGN